MKSTEQRLVDQLFEILYPIFSAENLVSEITLLCTCGYLSEQKYGSVLSDAHHSNLQDLYFEIAKDVGQQGEVIERSELPQKCPLLTQGQVLNALQGISGTDPRRLACALAALHLKTGNHRSCHPLPLHDSLITLLLGFINTDQHLIGLHYLSSVFLAPSLPRLNQVCLKTQWIEPITVAMSVLLNLNVSRHELREFESMPSGEFESVISIPPLGQRLEGTRLYEETAVRQAANQCKSKAVIVIPPSVLHQKATAGLRQYLIEKNLLDAVILLSKGTLPYSGIAPALFVISKHRAKGEPVLFLNADPMGPLEKSASSILELYATKSVAENGALAATEVIADNDYDLSVHLYQQGVATKQISKLPNTVPLSQLAEIIRAQSLKDLADRPDDAQPFLEAIVGDISETGQINEPSKKIYVDDKQLRRARSQRLQSGDVLLSVKGSIGRTALVGNDCEPSWIAGQLFQIIRPYSKLISSAYLYRYLSSSLVQAYLKEMETGATIQSLKANVVSELPVPVPDEQTKTHIEALHEDIMHQYQAIQAHRENIESLEHECWPIADNAANA